MKARLCLAALHFNENSSRALAVAKDGKTQYKISFPKARKDYVQTLMEEIVRRRELYHTYSTAHEARVNEMNHPPPAVTASYQKNLALDKDLLIQKHLHRFNT
ncbi:hypothetical protein ACJMK2_021793 [Sinanodonta woodiana]|uniref:Uncharacterized protein n=1 Tax=Sinanodonta woodiana TaxID=1069815 RepID=A0ABD3TH72_SINWO